MLPPMLRALSQRPSIAVGACTVVVLTFFALRGDLRLSPPAGTAAATAPRPPVVLQNPAAPRRAPMLPVSGRVFDALGFLVVGAEVVPVTGDRQRTDADGSFQLKAPEAGVVDLLVRAAGARPSWCRTTAISPDALIVQLLPVAPWDQAPTPLSPLPPLRGEGVVRDAAGRPLAGAHVTVRDTGLWARTDDLGRYSLPLAAASGTLSVHHADPTGAGLGHALAGQPFVSSREQGLVPLPDLVAGPAAQLRGIVRDARGAPLEGVPVLVRGDGLRRVVETGAGGAFRVGGLWAGACTVEPMPFRGALAEPVAVEIGAAAVDLELQLRPHAEARLLVVDQAGNALGDVYVAASVAGVRRAVVRTDRDGLVSLPIAAATEFEVRTADTFAALVVQRCERDADPLRLVVARP
jgi:hypothetical protein